MAHKNKAHFSMKYPFCLQLFPDALSSPAGFPDHSTDSLPSFLNLVCLKVKTELPVLRKAHHQPS